MHNVVYKSSSYDAKITNIEYHNLYQVRYKRNIMHRKFLLVLRFYVPSILQAIVAATFVAAAAAVPAGPPPPAYAPAPAPYKPAPYGKAPEKLPPQPFAYEYGVKDGYSGADYAKNENQDASGNVAGSYVVHLPDGRVQTVTYTADHYNGYVADVKYEGMLYQKAFTKK